MFVCLIDLLTAMLNLNILLWRKKSLGVAANQTLHRLYQLTGMDAKRRQVIKQQDEHSNLTKTDAKSICSLSNHVTKPCFNELMQKVLLARQCISKQWSMSEWHVKYIYMKESFDESDFNTDLPYIQRIRVIKKDTDSYLTCSCKGYERHGYPCHHLFHVLGCYDTKSVKYEWLHIRWTKGYTKFHYSRSETEIQRKSYEQLFDNFPPGPKHITAVIPTTTFPIYSAYNESMIKPEAFCVPPFQIMS